MREGQSRVRLVLDDDITLTQSPYVMQRRRARSVSAGKRAKRGKILIWPSVYFSLLFSYRYHQSVKQFHNGRPSRYMCVCKI